MDRAVVLFGAETGTAEDLAEDLAAALEEVGVEAEVVDMEDGEPGLLDGSRAVIVCTATHGDGELPDNSVDFYGALEEERPASARSCTACAGSATTPTPTSARRAGSGAVYFRTLGLPRLSNATR